MDLCHIFAVFTAITLVESQAPQRTLGTRPPPSPGSRRSHGKVGNINPYKAMIVKLHNDYRRSEGGTNIKLLRWSPRLANDARTHVDKCRYVHQYGNWGENLYNVESHLPDDVLIERALSTWYYEKLSWHWQPDCSEACHYTQMVWATTTEIGCAFKKCPILNLREEFIINGWFFACFYNPQGNEIGSFPYNIGQPCSECDRADVCRRGLCTSTKPVYYKPAKTHQTPRKPKDAGGRHGTLPDRGNPKPAHVARQGNQKTKIEKPAVQRIAFPERRVPIASNSWTEKKANAHYQPKSETRGYQGNKQDLQSQGLGVQHKMHVHTKFQGLKASLPGVDRKPEQIKPGNSERAPASFSFKTQQAASTQHTLDQISNHHTSHQPHVIQPSSYHPNDIHQTQSSLQLQQHPSKYTKQSLSASHQTDHQTQQVVEHVPQAVIPPTNPPPPLPPSVAPILKCPDVDANCRHWKVYCTSNPYVHDNCRNTCDTCHVPTPPQVFGQGKGQKVYTTTVSTPKPATQTPKPSPARAEFVTFPPTYDPSKPPTQPTFAPRATVGHRQQFQYQVQAGPTTARFQNNNAPQALRIQTTTARPQSYTYPTPTYAQRAGTTTAPYVRSQKNSQTQAGGTFTSGSSFPAGVGGPSFGPCRDFDNRCKTWSKYCGIDEYVDDMCRKTCHRCFA